MVVNSTFDRILRPGSRRVLGEIGVVVVVLAVATGGILVLRHEQNASQSRRFELERLHASLHAHSALEWRAIADGSISDEVREQGVVLDGKIRQQLALLLDSGLPRDPVAFARGVDAYLAAVERELELVEGGQTESAREVDETVVDPIFHSLEELVVENDVALEHQARASSRNADLGSIGIAVASLLALLFQGSRILRAEKAVAREAALAEHRDELRQAQKMDAVGLLAGGIAHDFNNLLTIVTGYGELVAEELGPDHECQAALSSVLGAAGRASELTRQLLAFGGKQVLTSTELELGAVCESMRTLLEGAVRGDVVLSLDVRERVHVLADRSQIEHALLNLVVNANDAMPRGGRIEISVGTCVLGTELKLRGERLPAGRYANLVVKDTGCGIDEETVGHIFDPYFTTKGTKGHGLGLSSVSGIVAQSGGAIGVETEPGAGTEFCVYLPALAAGAERTDAPTQRPAAA
jgi:signal transduction histidine kinase